jgi:dUTP pyrophosphatase
MEISHHNYHMSSIDDKEKHTYLIVRDEEEVNSDITIDIDHKNLWQRLCASFSLIVGKTIRSNFVFSDEAFEQFIYMLKKRRNRIEGKTFKVELLNKNSKLPTKSYDSDSGFDLSTIESFTLNPGDVKLVRFGIVIELEDGWEAQVRNRSGIVTRYRCMIPLGVGTVDSSYRGELMAPLFNFGREGIAFNKGERIAQLVIKRTENVSLELGKVDHNTKRGEGGFGSTGK